MLSQAGAHAFVEAGAVWVGVGLDAVPELLPTEPLPLEPLPLEPLPPEPFPFEPDPPEPKPDPSAPNPPEPEPAEPNPGELEPPELLPFELDVPVDPCGELEPVTVGAPNTLLDRAACVAVPWLG